MGKKVERFRGLKNILLSLVSVLYLIWLIFFFYISHRYLYRYWARPGSTCPMPSQPDRETERSRPLETWPRDRVAETFGDLAERPSGQDLWRLGRETERSRPLETWPRDREAETFGDLAERSSGQDLWRLGRETERPRPLETWPNDRVAETFGYLAERPRGRDLWRHN